MRIQARQYVASGTGFYTALGWLGLAIVYPIFFLVMVGITHGLWLIFAPIYWAFSFWRERKFKAMLRGSCLQLGPDQLPEIYETARSMASRLGLAECPEIYLIESNEQNAFAIKQGKKRFVLLVDDVVFGCLQTGNAGALEFVLGHELAHHALGHTDWARSTMRGLIPALSRLDEFSCDAVANALVGDPKAARDALCLLLVGPQLFSRVNPAGLERQIREVQNDGYTRWAERPLGHPLLLRRLARIANP